MKNTLTFENLPELTATLAQRLAALEALIGEMSTKMGNGSIGTEKLLYTRAEVQALLGISKPTMFKIDRRVLSYFFIGNDRRYRVKDVEKYINEQMKKTSGT